MVKGGEFLSLFRRFKNQNRPTEISTDDTPEKIAAFFGIEDIGNEQLKSTTYYACMQIRCNSLAKLPLKVMQRKDGNTDTAEKHPLFALLHDRPNPYMTAHDFLWATEYQRLSFGNAFWYPKRDGNGRCTAVYLLPSRSVSIFVEDEGVSGKEDAVFYQYTDPKLGPMFFRHDEILHFKNFAMNGLKGCGVATYLADVIGNEQASSKVLKKKYNSGLMDPVIVQYIGDLNNDKKTAIRKKFATLGGAENAGMVIPIPTDFKVSQLETKLVNSQFFELQGLTTKHIANAFGVKSFQLNDLERSTYANIENQNRSYYTDTLINTLTEYEQEMAYKLFSAKERETYFCKFNIDSLLRSDTKSRYESYQMGITGGFLTPAEARKMEDLPFVEGSDQLIYGNGAAIPLTMVGAQYVKGGETTNEDI